MSKSSKGVKLTGAEYAAFVKDPWGPDWYWDDTLFLHNGAEVDDIGEVADTDTIVLLEGIIFKGHDFDAERIDALPFARKWLKAQTCTSITVEVPNEHVAAFKLDMRKLGYRVL